MPNTSRRRRSDERGSMAVEVVLLVPVLVLVMLLVVAFGRYVDRRADVEAIARDAARAATLERTRPQAEAAANAVVGAAANRLFDGATCQPALLGGLYEAGQTITVTVRCQLRWSELAPVGFPGTVTLEAVAASPLDRWRRTG
jgi:Flp pilus assembly protein TadG